MAPCSTSYSSIHHIRQERDIKLRKPLVEKMRRDRINSCIEQLKLILEKEFQQQDPNAKLEKADILEMTVSFLRQQLQSGRHSQGYTHCWRESLNFLSVSPKREPSSSTPPLQGLQQQEAEQFHQVQRVSGSSPVCSSLGTTILQESFPKDPVWRPW